MPNKFMLAPFVALLAVAAIFAACGGDDDDTASDTPASTTSSVSGTATAKPSAAAAEPPTEAEAEAFIQKLVTDYNSGDLDTFLANFSDDGLVAFVGDEPGTSRAQAEADARANLSAGEITFHSSTKQSSDDSSITVAAVTDNGTLYVNEAFTLATDESGDPRVIGYEPLPVEVPDGTTSVLVEGTEFQYIFDPADITSGEVAFEFSNIGSQFHMLYLLKIDETTPKDDIVEAAVQATSAEELPASVLEDLQLVVAPPGASDNYVPVEPLESGRYLFICFIPDDADGVTPHASKGMNAEFTIP